MLQDIFISPLPEGLMSWKLAFPKAKISAVFEGKQPKQTDSPMYWLHMNEDRQQWLTNIITQIKQKSDNAKIIVLANAPNEAEALHAMSLGAVGYLHAYSPEKMLMEVKTVISHGGVWMGPDLLKRLIEVSSSLVGNQTEQIQQHLSLLSKREKQVALEAAKGLSNKEIARILKITERTVKAHLTSIFERLHVKDRLHLALILNQKP